MNRRDAKREATLLLADTARRAVGVVQDRGVINDRRYSAPDAERMGAAFLELADELTRRVTRERRPVSHPLDPNQASLFPTELSS